MLNRASSLIVVIAVFLAMVISSLAASPTPEAGPTANPMDKELAGRLQALLDQATEGPDATFPGALLFIKHPKLGYWAGAAGLSNIENQTAMSPGDKFRAGSIMKPFVAAVVLQLVEEGGLSLDDPLPSVLPEEVISRFPDNEKITVQMLLNHTAGIPEWVNVLLNDIAADPTRVWQVEEFLDTAAAQPSDFLPGEGWKYSNTDYNLLGLIIEQVTGNPWRDEVRRRIIRPLALKDTILPEPGDPAMPGSHVHGYETIEGALVDFTQVDPSMAEAAGGSALVTTTSDLVTFLEALLAGEFFQQETTLEQMLNRVKVPDDPHGLIGYGLGLEKYVLPGNVEMIGHLGSTAGYRSLVGHLPAYGITFAMSINTQGDPVPVFLPALQLLLDELPNSQISK